MKFALSTTLLALVVASTSISATCDHASSDLNVTNHHHAHGLNSTGGSNTTFARHATGHVHNSTHHLNATTHHCSNGTSAGTQASEADHKDHMKRFMRRTKGNNRRDARDGRRRGNHKGGWHNWSNSGSSGGHRWQASSSPASTSTASDSPPTSTAAASSSQPTASGVELAASKSSWLSWSSKAPTQTQASFSPAASSSSASSSGSSGTTYTGVATFFYQDGVAGACGNVNSDSTPLVALQTAMYGSGQYCGKTVEITNTANGKSVTATVQDECPGCSSATSLDLSTGAFDQIGDEATGVLPITWHFTASLRLCSPLQSFSSDVLVTPRTNR
ncbi:hypothetical protein JCM1840_001571 [Sporobolomyces johnsonii]